MENSKLKIEKEIEEYLANYNYELNNLLRLHRWLSKDIGAERFSNLIVLAAPFFLPFILLAMIIFTPIMIRSLTVLKRKKWIAGLFILVSIPLVLIFFTNIFDLKVILIGVSILAYFFFCAVLKIEIEDWYKDLRAKIQRERNQRESEGKDPLDWIIMQ